MTILPWKVRHHRRRTVLQPLLPRVAPALPDDREMIDAFDMGSVAAPG